MINPSFTYHENGQKRSEEYFLNDQYHRTDGLAYIDWYQNGRKRSEEYSLNGQLHRTDGPAYISWYEDGQKHSKKYYLNGQEIKASSDLEFKKLMKLMVFK